MMLWYMRIGTLDLDETFAANRLITAPGFVQVAWIVQAADGAFTRILVEICLEGLSVHQRISRELDLSWLCLGTREFGRFRQGGQGFGPRAR